MTARVKTASRYIPGGSVTLAATTLLSYVFGLLRDRTFARTFGASPELDAYNAAFILPDFLFNMFVASGIAAAFVPIFTQLSRKNKSDAETYGGTVLAAALGAMAFSAIAIALFAHPLTRLVAPGFTESNRLLAARLMQILALSPILFAASNAYGAALVAQRRFLFYGLSPLFYNAGIIGGTVFLAPRFGIAGAVLGTLGGAGLHVLLRFFDLRRIGYRLRINLAFRTGVFRETIRLMIPKMFGHPVELMTFWGFTAIASSLVPGSIAVLNFARNFQSVPVSVIGIAVSTAVFPLLANAAAERSRVAFQKILKAAFLLIALTSGLSALIAFFIRGPVIAVLLGGRAFTPEAIAQTALVFGVFTLAIPTEALAQLLARAYYATKNTTIPVASSIVSLAVSVGGGWILAPHLGLMALPLLFAAGSALRILILIALLPRRLKTIEIQSL